MGMLHIAVLEQLEETICGQLCILKCFDIGSSRHRHIWDCVNVLCELHSKCYRTIMRSNSMASRHRWRLFLKILNQGRSSSDGKTVYVWALPTAPDQPYEASQWFQDQHDCCSEIFKAASEAFLIKANVYVGDLQTVRCNLIASGQLWTQLFS